MATLVFFHAHPDDESIATGGTMAMAADAGHRVVLVLGTRGEHGEVAEGFLDPAETLGQRRTKETMASADILGVARVEFLDYLDSGMMGTPENDRPGSFWQADVEEAAARLAEILREEQADVLSIYDENGNYGHPDHIKVHRVGCRAADLAGTPHVYEATVNKDEMRRGMEEMMAAADGGGTEFEMPSDEEFESLGMPEHLLTTRIDVGAYLERKKQSMRAHASQIAETSFFLAMPDEAFARAFGVEWYIHQGVPTPVDEWETSILP